MLEFRPSIVGISALWCTLEHLFPQTSDTYIAYILRLLNQSSQKVIINRDSYLCFNIFLQISYNLLEISSYRSEIRRIYNI